MRSYRTSEFRDALSRLPADVQARALRAYQRFAVNPQHPSLRFKPVGPRAEGVYSVRIDRMYRALGVLDGDVVIWFWIGTHADYDRLVSTI